MMMMPVVATRRLPRLPQPLPLVLEQLPEHAPHVLAKHVPLARRDAHAVPQLVRRYIFRQLEPGANHGANVVGRHLVAAQGEVVPLARFRVETDFHDAAPGGKLVGFQAHAFALGQEHVPRQVHVRLLFAEATHAQCILVVVVSQRQNLDINGDRVQILPFQQVRVRPENVREVGLKNDAIRQVVVQVAVPVAPHSALFVHVRQQLVEFGPLDEILAHQRQGHGQVGHEPRVEHVAVGRGSAKGGLSQVAETLFKGQLQDGFRGGNGQNIKDNVDGAGLVAPGATVHDDFSVKDGARLDQLHNRGKRILRRIMTCHHRNWLFALHVPTHQDDGIARKDHKIPNAVRLFAHKILVGGGTLNFVNVVPSKVHGH